MTTIPPDFETQPTSPFEGWSRGVMASLAFLISILATQIVRISWFDAPTQPLSIQPVDVSWRSAPNRPMADGPDSAMAVIRALETSLFADTARSILGSPVAPMGLVDMAGRQARHIGEYIRSRDSVALAPSAIFSLAQLRHAYLHELSHHWMARHPELGHRLLTELPALTDSTRYGFGDPNEQAAEALAHAVQFWRATHLRADAVSRGPLLSAYEGVMPGTRAAYLMLIEAGSLPAPGLLP